MARSRALFSSQIAPQHLAQSTHHTGFPGTHTLSSKVPQNNHIRSVHTNSSAFADRTSPDLGSQHEAYSTPRALFFSIFTLKKLHPLRVPTCLHGSVFSSPAVSTATLSTVLPAVCLVRNTEGSIFASSLVRCWPPSCFHSSHSTRLEYFRPLNAHVQSFPVWVAAGCRKPAASSTPLSSPFGQQGSQKVQ